LDLIKVKIFFNTLILKWNHILVRLKKVNNRNKIHLHTMNYEGTNLTIIEIYYENDFYQNFYIFPLNKIIDMLFYKIPHLYISSLFLMISRFLVISNIVAKGWFEKVSHIADPTLHSSVPALWTISLFFQLAKKVSLRLFGLLISAWSTSPNLGLPRPFRSQFDSHILRKESLMCLAITAYYTIVSTVISQVYLFQGAYYKVKSSCLCICLFFSLPWQEYVFFLSSLPRCQEQSLAIKTTIVEGI